MTSLKTVLAIPGSTRQYSTNLGLLKAIEEIYRGRLNFMIFGELAGLPHFNPDLDTENPPLPIAGFRQLLNKADGILICTPEYAMGVPGSLKNAIDWTVSSMEFSHKPVALITASSSGQKGHAALMDTLRVIESEIPEKSQLIIPFVKTKIKDDKITDQDTLDKVKQVMESLIYCMDQKTNEKVS